MAVKTLVFSVVLLWVSGALSSAQVFLPQVDFNNHRTYATVADRDVYDACQRPIVGTNYVAQLYYGSHPSNLQVVSNAPARFRDPASIPAGSSLAGTWAGGTRILTGFTAGTVVTLQVRVWDTRFGATFEEAAGAGAFSASSLPFSYTIPPPGSAVSDFYMEGFRSMMVLWSPPPGGISISEVEEQMRLSFAVDYFPSLQVSDNFVTWTDLGARYGPYVETNVALLNRRFYRLNCGGSLSSNYVGFYRVNFAPGYTFLGNHLLLPDDRIRSIFPTVPEGTAVFRFDPEGGYVVQSYYGGTWEGDDPDMRARPGQGLIVYTPVAFSKTFVGEGVWNSAINLPAGFSLVSSALPQSLPLTGTGGLRFPAAEGDTIYQFNSAVGAYEVNTYTGQWEGDFGGATPRPAIGESFFVFKAVPGSWVRQMYPFEFPP